ncbi:hypothetical protein [Streptomyces sp. NBC_00203]|uniref:hypothetical protein n=1 Tax=Streptomyces sp. NBC_00203 TaxID=2975680 RepID=UPI00324F48D8
MHGAIFAGDPGTHAAVSPPVSDSHFVSVSVSVSVFASVSVSVSGTASASSRM